MPDIELNYLVPKKDDRLAQSQRPFLNNFQSISAFIDVNHVGFEDVDNAGKHNFLQMTVIPNTFPTPIVPNVAAMFTRNFGLIPNTVPVLVYGANYPGNLFSTIAFGVTRNDTVANQRGYFLFGQSILIKYGPIQLGGFLPSGTSRITFSTNDPTVPVFRVGTNPLVFVSYSVNIDFADPTSILINSTGVSDSLGFQIWNPNPIPDGSLASFYFIAIGLL